MEGSTQLAIIEGLAISLVIVIMFGIRYIIRIHIN